MASECHVLVGILGQIPSRTPTRIPYTKTVYNSTGVQGYTSYKIKKNVTHYSYTIVSHVSVINIHEHTPFHVLQPTSQVSSCLKNRQNSTAHEVISGCHNEVGFMDRHMVTILSPQGSSVELRQVESPWAECERESAGSSFTKTSQDLAKSRSCEIGGHIFHVALNFTCSTAAETPVKIQSDWGSLNLNLATLRLCEILRRDLRLFI